MQQAEAVIVGGIVAIAAYEIRFRRSDQLISHAFDRILTKYPVAGRIVIGVTALHLANLLDGKYLRYADPYKWMGRKW